MIVSERNERDQPQIGQRTDLCRPNQIDRVSRRNGTSTEASDSHVDSHHSRAHPCCATIEHQPGSADDEPVTTRRADQAQPLHRQSEILLDDECDLCRQPDVFADWRSLQEVAGEGREPETTPPLHCPTTQTVTGHHSRNCFFISAASSIGSTSRCGITMK